MGLILRQGLKSINGLISKIAQAGLQSKVVLPSSPEFWDYRGIHPIPGSGVVFISQVGAKGLRNAT